MEAAIIFTAIALTGVTNDGEYHYIPKHDSAEHHVIRVHTPSNPTPCEIAKAVTNKDGSVAYYTCAR